jgi:ribonuclease E
MRFAGNFHPEWGYLAPAPNFMRTARVVIVATAIGATAGAAVVLSLAERSAPGAMADAGKTLVVVHSLVQPAEAAAPAAAPVAAATLAPVITPVVTAAPVAPVAPAKVQASVQPSAPPATASAQPIAPLPAPSESRTVSTSAAPASVTALSESPPVTEASPPAATNDAAISSVSLAPQRDAVKKPAATGQTVQQPQRGPQPAVAAAPKKKPEERGLGPVLRRLFSAN